MTADEFWHTVRLLPAALSDFIQHFIESSADCDLVSNVPHPLQERHFSALGLTCRVTWCNLFVCAFMYLADGCFHPEQFKKRSDYTFYHYMFSLVIKPMTLMLLGPVKLLYFGLAKPTCSISKSRTWLLLLVLFCHMSECRTYVLTK